jgi:hypothetical protein
MQATRQVKKEAMVEKEEQTVRDQAKCSFVTPQSQKLLTRLKPHAIKQMFDALDTDKVRMFAPLLAMENLRYFSYRWLRTSYHARWRFVPSD